MRLKLLVCFARLARTLFFAARSFAPWVFVASVVVTTIRQILFVVLFMNI